MSLKSQLTQQLADYLLQGQISDGRALLKEKERNLRASMGPENLESFELHTWCAFWVDEGWEDGRSIVEDFRTRCRTGGRQRRGLGRVTLREYFLLRVMEGVLAMKEDFEQAIRHFDLALKLGGEVADGDGLIEAVEVVVLFYKGRSLRNLGRYEEAMRKCTEPAVKLARDLVNKMKLERDLVNRERMLFVALLFHGWLLELNGCREEAKKVLAEAANGLKQTNDHRSRGGASFYLARIASRSGREEDYRKAVEFFEAAKREYGQLREGNESRIGRTLIHRAFVGRDLARITGDVQERRKSREALEEAMEIYRDKDSFQDRHGMANAKLCNGYLWLDEGNAEKAIECGEDALRWAYQKTVEKNGEEQIKDPLIAVRGEILVVHALSKLPRNKRKDSAIVHAEKAKRVLEADRSRYARLWIRTLIALGRAHLAEGSGGKAQEYLRGATKILGEQKSEHDYVRRELEELEDEIDIATFGRPTIIELAEGRFPDEESYHETMLKVKQEVLRNYIKKNSDKTQQEIAVRLGMNPKTLRDILVGRRKGGKRPKTPNVQGEV